MTSRPGRTHRHEHFWVQTTPSIIPMPSYTSERHPSIEEKPPEGDFHSSRDDWDEKAADDTLQSTAYGFGSPISSEGEIPPPPPDELESSDFTDQSSVCSAEDESSRSSNDNCIGRDPPPPPSDELDSNCSVEDENSRSSGNAVGCENSATNILATSNDDDPLSGKRRYTGDCSYEEYLVTREEGKSDVSSELQLSNLRFEYSNISSCSSSRQNVGKRSANGTTRHEASNIISTNSSLSIDSAGHTEMNDILQSCYAILKAFALRCAFDHLRSRCGTTIYDIETDCSLQSPSSLSTDSISAYMLPKCH